MPYSEIRYIKDASNVKRPVADVAARGMIDAYTGASQAIGYADDYWPYFYESSDLVPNTYVLDVGGGPDYPAYIVLVTCTSSNSKFGVVTEWTPNEAVTAVDWQTGPCTDKPVLVPIRSSLLVEYNVSGDDHTPDGTITVKAPARIFYTGTGT